MKKLFALVLSVVLMLSLTACGSSSENETTKQEAKEGEKTFTVGFDAEYPPYGYLDAESGEYVGFDLDLAEKVCEMEGWKLVKKPINWDTKDTEINSGSIDCIWNGMTIHDTLRIKITKKSSAYRLQIFRMIARTILLRV